MPRQRTRLHYKILVDKIIKWLDCNIDDDDVLASDSADLKEKIELYLEGQDEF